MFVERARARDRSFQPSEGELEQIEQLCDLLDGLPLAIELASARVRVLGVHRLLDTLQGGLAALGTGGRDLPSRQRSLDAALAWTLGLLTPPERDVFVSLGAFAASWSLEEAEQLLAGELDETEVWEALNRLLDASLVVIRGDGRFAMPQRVRQHAAQLLASAPTGDGNRRRHAEVIGLELRELHLEMFVDYRRMLANIADLLPEARHALSWIREHAPDACRSLVGRIAPALAATGELALVADDLDSFASPAEPGTVEDAAISYAHGLLHAMRWSTDTAGEVGHFDAAERGFLACGDARAAVVAIFGALCALEAGGVSKGVPERCSAQLRAAQQITDPRWHAEVSRLNAVGWTDSASLDLLDRITAELGPGTGGFAAMSTSQRYHTALRDGDLPSATHWMRHALETYPPDQLYSVLNTVKALSWLLVLRREDARSLELRTAVDAIYRSRTGSEHRGFFQSWNDGFAESRTRLTADEISQSEAGGLALSYEGLIERATEVVRACSSEPVDERT